MAGSDVQGLVHELKYQFNIFSNGSIDINIIWC